MRFLGLAAWLLVSALVGAEDLPLSQLRTFRDHAGLSLPVWDAALARSCTDRARVLAAWGELSHEDADGRGVGEQLTALGFPPGTYGEVLGAGNSLDRVWEAWLASSPHRAVLSSPRWRTWGAGWAAAGSTKVWVLRFAGP